MLQFSPREKDYFQLHAACPGTLLAGRGLPAYSDCRVAPGDHPVRLRRELGPLANLSSIRPEECVPSAATVSAHGFQFHTALLRDGQPTQPPHRESSIHGTLGLDVGGILVGWTAGMDRFPRDSGIRVRVESRAGRDPHRRLRATTAFDGVGPTGSCRLTWR